MCTRLEAQVCPELEHETPRTKQRIKNISLTNDSFIIGQPGIETKAVKSTKLLSYGTRKSWNKTFRKAEDFRGLQEDYHRQKSKAILSHIVFPEKRKSSLSVPSLSKQPNSCFPVEDYGRRDVPFFPCFYDRPTTHQCGVWAGPQRADVFYDAKDHGRSFVYTLPASLRHTHTTQLMHSKEWENKECALGSTSQLCKATKPHARLQTRVPRASRLRQMIFWDRSPRTSQLYRGLNVPSTAAARHLSAKHLPETSNRPWRVGPTPLESDVATGHPTEPLHIPVYARRGGYEVLGGLRAKTSERKSSD
uniref:Testis expressed 26 n=1 Tax=Steinernema glaseri TaxID=37863 RepID=A0A1I8AVK1_9BILA